MITKAKIIHYDITIIKLTFIWKCSRSCRREGTSVNSGGREQAGGGAPGGEEEEAASMMAHRSE